VDGPPTALVRPALELAWAVAREGGRQRPAIAVPGPLRPLVRFSRLPERALDAVRRVVETDEDFRARVSAAADERTIGRVAWLWLSRPEGWSDEVGSAAAAAEVHLRAMGDRRAEQSAQRRVVLLEASLERGAAELAATRAALAEMDAELARLRRERRAEQQEAARHRAALARSIGSQTDAERRAADAEACTALLRQRLAATQTRLAASETANGELTAQSEAARVELVAAEQLRRMERHRAATTASALGRAVEEAVSAAKGLEEALARATRVLVGGDEAVAPVVADEAGRAGRRSRNDTTGKGERHAAPVGRARRLPAPLPRAMLEDSPDAAAWLVRLPGAVVVVDGYNVTLAAWSGRDLADQRHRLVTALAELSMRTGAQVEVVFDGDADHAHPLRSTAARRAVRALFSPPGVDADEVIIERVGQLPEDRPVIVATDDRRLREECRRAGANVLTVEQLVNLLGRSGGTARP
jgi:predicted RNA-binding protein with PIN domain